MSLNKTIKKIKPKAASSSIALNDPVQKYLSEIRKYPLLSPKEEKELAIHFKETGDVAAAQKLVTGNLRFVVKIAMEYSKRGNKLIDLIQEGNVGLVHAVKEFNPYKDVKLISYAVWWIRGYIQEYLMKQYSMVKIGTTQAQRKLFYKLKKETSELEALGKDVTTKLISDSLAVPEKDVKIMQQRLSGRDVSLSQPTNNDSQTMLIDLQPSEYNPVEDQLEVLEETQVLKEEINKLRPDLNERELVILNERVLADKPITLQEIGTRYNTSREAARQVEARLLKKIQKIFLERYNSSTL